MSLLPFLCGDETRVAVLRTLRAAPDGLTQRALAARIGRSPSHVNRTVQAFEGLGVIRFTSDQRVSLEQDSPLTAAVLEMLDIVEPFEAAGRFLRTIIRHANERFGDRYFVGGYQAAVRLVQPIDFTSDRVDLYVKGLAPKDRQWLKGIRHLTPYDVHLHTTKRLAGLIEDDATLDGEPCAVALPEVAAFQCLEDATFPRYGAFLILVQGLDEWGDGAGGFPPQRLDTLADGTRWEGRIRELLDYVEGRHKEPPQLEPDNARALKAALNTVRGA